MANLAEKSGGKMQAARLPVLPARFFVVMCVGVFKRREVLLAHNLKPSVAPAQIVKPMLTVRELADMLGIVPATIWRGVADGRFPKPLYPAARSPRWVWDEVKVAMERTRAMPAAAMMARRDASRSARLSGRAA